jgi:hypothetical protein
MADTRITPSLTPTPPQGAGAPARTDAALAAQRAFFQAALSGAEIPAPVAPARTEAKAAAEPARNRARDVVRDLPEGRILRPGSLVDIKI